MAFLSTLKNMSSGVILLILCYSFTTENTGNSAFNPEQYKEYSSLALQEINQSVIDSSGIPTQTSGYFHKVFYGNGLDHMNINLVAIDSTGLITGDEIGVFDGTYCVGSAVIADQDMQYKNLSIAASVNDTIESSPNGFIEGHNINLRAYRNGVVYQLYFRMVNDSQNIFERRASMFAIIDFSKSPAIDKP